MRIVQKFGGSSLADAAGLGRAAGLAAKAREEGAQVIVVVSAMGKSTDALCELARSICPSPPAREMDALLSTGELQSAALLAIMLSSLGIPARSFSGGQAGIFAGGSHGNAVIDHIECEKLRPTLEEGTIAVVTGFQALGPDGSVCTLGRGGSDTTAVALAAFLGADLCRIYTDVDGVYDRDPQIFPDAVRFHRISYEKMMALIENGAQVLHDRSVEFARSYGICIEVLSAFTGAPGTIVGP